MARPGKARNIHGATAPQPKKGGKMKTFLMFIGLLISLPIRLYITYSILVAIEADRLLWFLFWVVIPVDFLGYVYAKLLEIRRGQK